MTKNRNGTMTVLEHLAELRLRLLFVSIFLLVGAIFSFTQVETIRQLFTDPLGDLRLIYLSPPEAFTANLRLALVSGLVISFPMTIYQLAGFLFPAFTRREKIFFSGVLVGVCLLFASGLLFAYMIVYPFTINFFLQFASADLDPRFNISDYLSFIFSFHLAFGFVFQLPLLTWALGRIGVLSTNFLRRNRKFALLIMLVLAALITPPDVISQIIMVGPLLLLYEIGILMVWISERKRLKEDAAAG